MDEKEKQQMWEEFKRESDKELERRLENHRKWEGLKRSGAQALRAAKHKGNNLGERAHGFGGEVETQDLDVVSANSSAPNFAKWASMNTTEEGDLRADAGYKDPDSFSESDAYFNSVPATKPLTGDQIEVGKDLLKALGHILTPRQLEIYSLKVERGYSVTEIAELLGVSHVAVVRAWNAIEKRLRKVFKKLGGKGA